MNEKDLNGKGRQILKRIKEFFSPRSSLIKRKDSRSLEFEILIKAENLLNKGKYDDTLSILDNLEEDTLTASDQLTFHLVKSSLLNRLGNYAECYKYAEQAYQE
ncbi:unnamed protein product, partial [marine sediment metagenome]